MVMRIMLVDDHKMFREALRAMLEKEPGMAVVAEAGDGPEAVRLAQEASPDVVCMDIGLPGMNGIEVTRRMLAACPAAKVVALSAHTEERYVLDMLQAGAKGYVIKANAGEELLRAIGTVCRNGTYLCPDIAGAVTEAVFAAQKDDSRAQSADRLGARERQVLQLVAGGLTSVEIADRLHIAQSTVDVHRRNIMRKLDLHNVADLTRYALRVGLVSD